MFAVDYRSRVPLYQQIVDHVTRLAARGILPPGTQLPSVRALAVQLSLNPNTVSRAYGELEQKGVIYSLPGRGSFISADSGAFKAETRRQTMRSLTELARQAAALGEDGPAWLELCGAAWRALEGKQGGESDD